MEARSIRLTRFRVRVVMVVMRLSLEIADGFGAGEGRETRPDELGEGGVTTQLDGFGLNNACRGSGGQLHHFWVLRVVVDDN